MLLSIRDMGGKTKKAYRRYVDKLNQGATIGDTT